MTAARGAAPTGSRRLTYDPAPDTFGSFDPGGRLVVWSSGAGGRYAIATAPLRSGHGGVLLGSAERAWCRAARRGSRRSPGRPMRAPSSRCAAIPSACRRRSPSIRRRGAGRRSRGPARTWWPPPSPPTAPRSPWRRRDPPRLRPRCPRPSGSSSARLAALARGGGRALSRHRRPHRRALVGGAGGGRARRDRGVRQPGGHRPRARRPGLRARAAAQRGTGGDAERMLRVALECP